MDAIEALTTRSSLGRTTEPAPEGSDLDLILRAALRAPDHKSLRPFRFLLVRDEARHRLGDVFARALLARQPDATPDMVERERGKVRRAPLLIVVVVRAEEGVVGVPRVEQFMSAAAAAGNILLAAHALGYGAMWRTGAPAYDPTVQAALGLGADESIAAFLYLGTPTGRAPACRTTDPAPFVAEWNG